MGGNNEEEEHKEEDKEWGRQSATMPSAKRKGIRLFMNVDGRLHIIEAPNQFLMVVMGHVQVAHFAKL